MFVDRCERLGTCREQIFVSTLVRLLADTGGHPGYIETPMVANAPAIFRQANIDATPLGTVGQPEDVGNLIIFLISDESKYISGAEIAIDGGFSNQAGVKFLSDAVRAAAPALPAPEA